MKDVSRPRSTLHPNRGWVLGSIAWPEARYYALDRAEMHVTIKQLCRRLVGLPNDFDSRLRAKEPQPPLAGRLAKMGVHLHGRVGVVERDQMGDGAPRRYDAHLFRDDRRQIVRMHVLHEVLANDHVERTVSPRKLKRGALDNGSYGVINRPLRKVNPFGFNTTVAKGLDEMTGGAPDIKNLPGPVARADLVR